jgi:hypothetical protein
MTQMELRSPEDLLAVGFSRSRVVMVNEAHDRMTRCVRMREIGLRLLPVAHEAGVRHMAMEALPQGVDPGSNWSRLQVDGGYLAQREMRRLIQGAEELGWTLIPYETRRYPVDANGREEDQARNLVKALTTLAGDAPLLVWCGWGHLYKDRLAGSDLRPMASQFWELSGVEPFSIDQTVTVEAGSHRNAAWHELAQSQQSRLEALGGTAGFLVADSPIPYPWVDAVLLSTENTLE